MGAVSTGAATLTWTRAGREPTGWDPSYSPWRPGSPRPLRSNLGVPIGGGESLFGGLIHVHRPLRLRPPGQGRVVRPPPCPQHTARSTERVR